MIKIIGITDENKLETDISINNANFAQYKWYWVDFNEPTVEEVRHLTDTFHFHPLAVEDCVQTLERPKLDYYDDCTFYVTHKVSETSEEIIKEELDSFVGDNFIVTFHLSASKEVDQIRNRLLYCKNIEEWDSYYILYEILDKIVDNYFPLINKIEDELLKIEDDIQNDATDDVIDHLFDIRHRLLIFRQTVNPMRDLLYRMLNSRHLGGIKNRREYFSDIHDNLLKVTELITSNREVTTDMRDSYLSMVSHQSNNLMKTLTIMTSIFSPLTLISGIYGMNFKYMPILQWEYGYYAIMGLMLIIGVLMYLWIKRKD